MEWVIKVATCFVVLFLPTWLYQEQNQEWDILQDMLKMSGNNAVHDAGLFVNDIAKSNGKIVFDQIDGRREFEVTLQKSLGLDTTLKPVVGSRFRGQVTVLLYEVLDESNTTFPFLYNNGTYKVTKYLSGPAVVAVLQTPHPVVLNRVFVQEPIKVPVIYEYKPDGNK